MSFDKISNYVEFLLMIFLKEKVLQYIHDKLNIALRILFSIS